MDKTYTPRHVGRERFSETGEGVSLYKPRHRAFAPKAEAPTPAPADGGVR